MTIPSLKTATTAFARLGLLSFGGPAAQIAMMQKMFVSERAWITEKQFMSALGFCMLLPGPEAMQLATYLGWRLFGVLGGLIAGLLFVIPGAIFMYALCLIYTFGGDLPWMQAAFLGIKSAVTIVVIEALLRLSKRGLKTRAHWLIAAVAFIAIYVFAIPFPFIIFGAGIYGYFMFKSDPQVGNVPLEITIKQTFKTIIIWLCIWLTPLLILGMLTNYGFYFEVGKFFSKLATVTFGGAYAVLAYMAQSAVNEHHWLNTAEMIDGLGLAETTPGPLILVTQFVGYVAGVHHGGILSGIFTGLIVLWVTFAPCFLWIFAGAPYVEWITSRSKLSNALSGILAAVVGVVLSLSLWFGLHVFFSTGHELNIGWLQFWMPEFSSINLTALLIAAISYALLIKKHMNILWVLLIAICFGLALI